MSVSINDFGARDRRSSRERPRRHQAHSGEADFKADLGIKGDGLFDGPWSKGHIEGTRLTWPSGQQTSIKRGGSTVSMEIEGQVHVASLSPDMTKMLWSDGDVWERRGPVPRVEAKVEATVEVQQTPQATVLVDVDGDGVADYRVTGVDRNHDGIPDALQQHGHQGKHVPVHTPQMDVQVKTPAVSVSSSQNYHVEVNKTPIEYHYQVKGDFTPRGAVKDSHEVVSLRNDVEELKHMRESADLLALRAELETRDTTIASLRRGLDDMREKKFEGSVSSEFGNLTHQYEDQLKKEHGELDGWLARYKADTEHKIDDLYKEKHQIEERCTMLNEKNRQLLSDLEARDHTISSLQKLMAQTREGDSGLSTRIQELESQVVKESNTCKLLEGELSAVRAREMELRTQASGNLTPRSKANHLEAEVERLRQENTGLNHVLQKYKEESAAQIESLHRQYTDASFNLQQTGKKCRDLEGHLAVKDVKITSLEKALAACRAEGEEAVAKLRASMRHMEEELQSLKFRNAQLQSEAAPPVSPRSRVPELPPIDMGKVLEEYRTETAEKIQLLYAQHMEKSAHCKELEERCRQQEAEIARLRLELRDARQHTPSIVQDNGLEIEVARLRNDNQGLVGILANYTDENTIQLEKLRGEFGQLQAHCHQLQEKIRALEAALGAKDITIVSLEKALAEARNHNGELSMLKQMLHEAKERENALEREIEALRNRQPAGIGMIDMDGAFAEITDKLALYKDDTATRLYQEKLEEMRKQYLEISLRYQELSDSTKQQEHIAKAERRLLEEELHACKQREAGLHNELDRLRSVTSQLEISLQHLGREKDGLLALQHQGKDAMDQEFSSLSHKLGEKEFQLHQAMEKVRGLESTLQARDVTIQSLEGMLISARGEMSDNLGSTAQEVSQIELEMKRITESSHQNMEKLQQDMLRLQMKGKEVAERELYMKINHDYFQGKGAAAAPPQRSLAGTHAPAGKHAPMATVLVDVDGDGVADYRVTGADRNHDGIPDALQSSTISSGSRHR